MVAWRDLLEGLVAGVDDAPHLRALRLPMLDGWESGRAWTTWEVESDFLTPAAGSLFGGYIAALADQLLACATFTVLADAESFATSEVHVHFLRPVMAGTVEIEGRVVSRTRRLVYCEVTLTDSDGEILARGGATQIVRNAHAPLA